MVNKAKLESLIKKINWLFDSFAENDFKNVSALEKALLKEKVLMLYDEIESIDTKIQKEKIKSEEPAVISKEKNEKITEEPKIPVLEKPIEEVKNIIQEVEVKIEEEKPKKEVIIEKEIEKPIKIQKTTVEEKIYLEKKEISSKGKLEKKEAFKNQISSPKRDMREIIDLNKSFIFKAELFKQNNELYTQFINEINTTRTENEAFSILINWTEKLNWKTDDNKAYDLLLRSVEKRFLPLI